MRDYPTLEKMNPVLQVLKMKKLFPQFTWAGKSGKYVFRGILNPSSNSQGYYIRINYDSFDVPKVFVDRPKIRDDAPHRYQKDKSLCLYHPKNFQWEQKYFLADTVVPWTIAWLYFYEAWIKTGIWYGPEAEHTQEGRI